MFFIYIFVFTLVNFVFTLFYLMVKMHFYHVLFGTVRLFVVVLLGLSV